MRTVMVALTLAVTSPLVAQRLDSLDVLNRGYPRAFFFRMAEGQARSGRVPWETWDATFSRLNGIIGKCLDEEIPGTSTHNIDYFTRFKEAHPEQVVLLHFNGNACDPRDADPRFFAGHWVYHNGCGITEGLPAEEGEAVVHLEDPSLFRVDMGRYKDKNEDIGICLLGDDGRPDWSRSEQLQLLSIDAQAKTLTVKRAAFGTEPMAFPAGRTYIAAHVTEGPWGKRNNLLWFYNYATNSPRSPEGLSCVDVLVAQLAERLGPDGPLSAFDGLEFDVLSHDRSPGGGFMPARAMDCDADGSQDGGVFGGVNRYGLGVYEMVRRLREALGDDRVIQADGHGERSQRCFGLLNGIESEGWPWLADWDIVDWSGGLNRHFFWRDNGREPVFNYVNHKFVLPDETRIEIPLNISRLVLATCQFHDSVVTYALAPKADPDRKLGVWDELRKGTEDETNWLGMPKGPPVRLGLQAMDLLANRGVQIERDFVDRLELDGCGINIEGRGAYVKVVSADPEASRIRFAYRGLSIPKGDLLIGLRTRSKPRYGHPQTMPRLFQLACRLSGDLVTGEPLRTGMALRGEEEVAVDAATGATVRHRPKGTIAGETHRSYFLHPPYKGGSGFTFWEAATRVPGAPARLCFLTGIGDTAKAPSDGITFIVEAHEGDTRREVFSVHHTELAWEAHQADISRYAGQEVTFRFASDCGPDDNTTADHSYWGDVMALPGTPGDPLPETRPFTPERIMTWSNQEWSDCSFYFRDRGPGLVDLEFEFEGSEDAYFQGLTVHNAADAICREFDNGVVLANPSMRGFEFDLATLFPGGSFRRLKGMETQAPEVNDGTEVGDTVTLPARDGLFLVRR